MKQNLAAGSRQLTHHINILAVKLAVDIKIHFELVVVAIAIGIRNHIEPDIVHADTAVAVAVAGGFQRQPPRNTHGLGFLRVADDAATDFTACTVA